MQIGDFFFAVFTLNVGWNIVHRPRTIQRHNRDKVFKAVGFDLFVNVAHARRFKLENGRGIAALQHFVSRFVVQRHFVNFQIYAAAYLNPVDGFFNNRQSLQSQKVKFD